MCIDRLTGEVRAAQQASLLARVMGGQVEWVSLDEAISQFEDRLAAVPVVMDSDEWRLREVLGLRGHRG